MARAPARAPSFAAPRLSTHARRRVGGTASIRRPLESRHCVRACARACARTRARVCACVGDWRQPGPTSLRRPCVRARTGAEVKTRRGRRLRPLLALRARVLRPGLNIESRRNNKPPPAHAAPGAPPRRVLRLGRNSRVGPGRAGWRAKCRPGLPAPRRPDCRLRPAAAAAGLCGPGGARRLAGVRLAGGGLKNPPQPSLGAAAGSVRAGRCEARR